MNTELSIPEVSKQRSLLEALSQSKEYFFSPSIIRRVAGRCRWILERTDLILIGSGVASALLPAFDRLSEAEQEFLVRSTPLRYEIERLSKYFGEPSELRIQAHLFGMRLRSVARPMGVDSAWFDSTRTLVGTYPFTVIAHEPGTPGLLSESSLVNVYYKENYRSLLGGGLELSHFSDVQLQSLTYVLEVIKAIDPGMLSDIALHVRHFCLVDFASPLPENPPSVSYSSRHLLGACFISPQIFKTFGLLLESIYHESLHMKFFNTILTHQLFIDDPSAPEIPTFTCSWAENSADSIWNLDRVLAAFHVYLHLHVFYAMLQQEVRISVIPDPWINDRLRVANYKGHILMEWLDVNINERLSEEGVAYYADLRGIFLRSVQLNAGTAG